MTSPHLPHIAVASQFLALSAASQSQEPGNPQLKLALRQLMSVVQPAQLPEALQAATAGAVKATERASASDPAQWPHRWRDAWMSWLDVCVAWSAELD